MLKTGTLSRLSKKCNACPHKDDCKNKRMEQCAYLIPSNAMSATTMASNEGISTTINVGHFGDIDTATLLEAAHKQLDKALSCAFNVARR